MREKPVRPAFASAFCGIGGIDLALEQAGFSAAWACDADPYPVRIYNANFKEPARVMDIRDADPGEIPEFGLLAGGFPCQPFSFAGERQGFADRKGRGGLFFELVRILEARRPEALLFENVKGLAGHGGGKTLAVMEEALEALGYTVFAEVLNASGFGVPQNRERVYIAGFRDREAASRFAFPEPSGEAPSLEAAVGFGDEVPERYYYGPSCPFFSELEQGVPEGAVCQWRRRYVRVNKSGLIPALTANMGGGGHNVPIIRDKKGRIRKLTPRECLRAQGFPEGFSIPEGVSDTRAYKAAGNSVAVPAVRAVAERIGQALEGGAPC